MTTSEDTNVEVFEAGDILTCSLGVCDMVVELTFDANDTTEMPSGTISSDFEDVLASVSPDQVDAAMAALTVVETIVLTQACCGVDVSLPSYIDGIKLTIDDIKHMYSDP